MKKTFSLFKRILTPSLFVSTLLLFTQCKKDPQIIPVDNSSTKFEVSNQVMSTTYENHPIVEGHYIINDLPAGYVKDGSVDYTSIIQNAIIKYPTLVFPGFPILINDNGLKIGSNKTLSFLPGSELKLKPSAKANYDVLSLRAVTNVTLINPVIRGDRYTHIGTSGEWGIGIGVYGSSNITILSPQVYACWGDGIYLGVQQEAINKNIIIKNAYLEYNRRDGISIIAVDGLVIDKMYAGFTNGTSPMCGLNFEPDSPKDELKNIVLRDITTQSNGGQGIQIGFDNMYGGGNKSIGITITNHIDKGSAQGFKTTCNTMRRLTGETIKGVLKLVNPSWIMNSVYPITTGLFGREDIHLILENPSVTNLSNKLLSNDETRALLTFKRCINADAWYTITFTNATPIVITPTVVSPIVISPIVVSPTPVPVPVISPTPALATNAVVFAVNAGGGAYTSTREGITYAADANFTGGAIYRTTNAISNTQDDPLYQSERYGNFSYAIPVANGTYEITFRFVEVYHSSAGKRLFDTRVEGVEVISNFDIYAVSGKNNAYDIVKTVQVGDGTLNINFSTDVDNAKVSAFHVIKK